MSFAILSNHKIHHIYLNLAVLFSYNQNCMMYYMRLCNAEDSQGPNHIFLGCPLGFRVPSRVKFGGSFLEGT